MEVSQELEMDWVQVNGVQVDLYSREFFFFFGNLGKACCQEGWGLGNYDSDTELFVTSQAREVWATWVTRIT